MTEGIAGFTAPVERARPPAALAWRLAPVGVALGSLCLSAAALGHRSLTTDEAAAAAQARGSLASVLSTVVHDDPGSAGHLLLLRLAASVGDDERTLRAPSAIAVAIAAGLLVILGTMMLGRLAGLVAGIALAANAGVVEASREARPYALGLLGIVAATLLFVYALERGGGWRWIPYAIAAAALPLTHPLAASVLAAHGAALIAFRGRDDLRGAGIALLTGTTAAGVLLAWMAADRLDAPDGAGNLDLARLSRGLAHAAGWNPVLVVAAIAGLVVLLGARSSSGERWHGVLVAMLIAAPVVATLLAAIALPVYVGALVLCAPGLALAAGAVAPLLSPVRGLVWAGLAVLLVGSAAAIAARLSAPPVEDWRALARAVERVRGPHETVVVVPERSRAAFAYYAPSIQVIRFARGDGAWVAVIADTPAGAIAAARPSVSTPRYALLRQFRYGDNLTAAALGSALELESASWRPPGGAELGQHALPAPRLAGVAHPPAVPDHEMRKPVPVGPGHDLDEIALDLHRILFAGQPETLRDPPHVGIDDDALRLPQLRRNNIGRLPGHSRQPQQLGDRPRHRSSELLDQHPHRATDRLRLLPVEAGLVDVLLELLLRHREVVLRDAGT